MASVEQGVAPSTGASRATATAVPRWLSTLIGLGLLGQAILIASAWLLPAVSEFGVAGDFISELVRGRFGSVQTSAFVIAGATAVGMALGLWGAVPATRAARISSVLVAVYGVAMVLTAIFPTDRIDSLADVMSLSVVGMIHLVAAVMSLLASFGGLLLLTWALRRYRPLLPSLGALGLVLGVALVLVFVVEPGPWVGLVQRLLASFVAAWLILVVLALRSERREPMTSTSSGGQRT